MNRREFLEVLSVAAACGGLLRADGARAAASLYEFAAFGNVRLLHFTDCHAQLEPVYFREASTDIGAGAEAGRIPHRVGNAWLEAARARRGGALAYAFTALDFEAQAHRYGRVGGFAALATLVKRLRAGARASLLLDGGDSWQGSATALWSRGQDMVDAAKLLGVDAMTGHWEFTYGAERIDAFARSNEIAWIAHNVRTKDFDEPVFAPFVIREVGGAAVAIIGQAFPYVPIAHPPRFVPAWTFGIQERNLQLQVDAARAAGAAAVILLSHNGLDADLKLATRVGGIDAILGGHTHDALPSGRLVTSPSGRTLVTNAGSHGKFLGVLDLDVRGRRLRDVRYRLLPVFADLLAPDPAMRDLVERIHAPHRERLAAPLAVAASTLYRRGNFGGSMDQVILDALRAVEDAPIALSPGFRWGPTLLAGDTITRGDVYAQTGITYPQVHVREMTGAQIRAALEDVCDNLFNPDPYLQQGGDMVRVSGLQYACAPRARMGERIRDLRIGDVPLDADRRYKVAGWAPVGDAAPEARPIWDVVEAYLLSRKTIRVGRIEAPRLVGVDGDPGLG